MLGAATLLIAAAPATAVTPAEGVLYENAVAVDGDCLLQGNGTAHFKEQNWLVYTVDPARIKGGSKVQFTPQQLPRYEEIDELGTEETSPMVSLQGWRGQGMGGGCELTALPPDAEASGNAVVLHRPGPYVFQQFDFQTDWVIVPDSEPDPTPAVCAANDAAHYPHKEGLVPEQDPGDNMHWAVQSYCNKVTVTRFSVKGEAPKCPVNGDMSLWPGLPYINQYDAGARLALPVALGYAGGNACGPSSLLMALARSGAAAPPSLQRAYDRTMVKPRDGANPGADNVFVGAPKAVSFLKSIGYRQADTIPLPADVQAATVWNIVTLNQALYNGPVVASTWFGSGRWGLSGGGHMIAITGVTAHGYEVSDPAGNYFAGATGHYGPKKCGYDAVYPTAWMRSYLAGRWLLTLGPRSAARAGRSATAELGSAVAVMDAHPDSSDNARSFYLQDPSGRRAGWIDGAVVKDIPDASVGQQPAAWSDPDSGDPDADPAPADPPPLPRAIVLAAPVPGTTLHVVADAGSPFALAVEGWVDGDPIATDALTGTGTGQDAALAAPALDAVTAVTPAPEPTAPTPTPTPTTTPTATVAPVLSALKLSPTSFRAATRGASAARTRTGTRVTFGLSTAAGVRFTVERRTTGRRVRGRCVAQTRRNRKAAKCVRYVPVKGSFTRTSEAGANSFRFTGRIGGRKLRAARYRLVAVPSAHRQTGVSVSAAFRIVR